MKIKFYFSAIVIFNISCMDNLYLYPDNELIIKYQNDWQKELYHKKILEFKKMPIGYNKLYLLGTV